MSNPEMLSKFLNTSKRLDSLILKLETSLGKQPSISPFMKIYGKQYGTF